MASRRSTATFAGANDGRCEALAKSTRERCKNPAMPGRNVCEDHGGPGGRPPTSYRDVGLYKDLGFAQTTIEAIRSDPELASHRENIVLLENLMAREAKGATPPAELWERAGELYRAALKEGDSEALRELGKVLETGLNETLRLERIKRLLDQQRKHKEAETRREAQLDNGLTSRQAMTLLGMVYTVVAEEIEYAFAAIARGEEVSSTNVLRRIGGRIRRHVAQSTGGSVLPGG